MKLRTSRRAAHDSLDEPNWDEDGDRVPLDFDDWRQIPSKELEQAELRRPVARAIASLRPKYRAVLILRDVQQFSIAETAALLGIKQCAVKARLFRARLQMRDALPHSLDSNRSRGSEKPGQVRTASYAVPGFTAAISGNCSSRSARCA